jgi:hypothetical protein
MTNIDERAEFEKWMFNNNPPYAAANRDAKGNYTWTRAAFAWDGWNTRANLPTAEVSDDEVMDKEITDIHRFISMFRKYLPDLEKIDTKLRFAVLPEFHLGKFTGNDLCAADNTVYVSAATIFSMLQRMALEEMRLRALSDNGYKVPEYEVARVMAEGMEPTYSDTYSSKELIEKALCALSDNGYKVVRK